jgi:hypothetical protein
MQKWYVCVSFGRYTCATFLCQRPVLLPIGCAGERRGRAGLRVVVLGLFFVCCLYSVDVIKSAKGAYLEISSSSKHECNMLN